MRLVAAAWDESLESTLEEREEAGLLRGLRAFGGVGRTVVDADGRQLLNFSSNDYLGLAGHPALAGAAARAARDHGSGSTASRLIVGGYPALEELEEQVAEHKGTESALVLGSGYLANVGVIPALAHRGDAIFSDALNHASIVDGCRLSRADVQRYAHRDVEQLESLLRDSRAERKLIVTDTVFSMDGDVVPLVRIAELKERYGAALLVDDAHGAGVFGPHGAGLAHELGAADAVDLHVGTFSKAYGCYGAYVAGRAGWLRYLHNACRSLIYSTALPPPVVAAASAALAIACGLDEERRALLRRSERFRAGVSALGLDVGDSTTQIVPVVVGGAAAALALSQALEEQGVLAVAIRPPTVPEGTARLRFSLTASLRDLDVEQALAALSTSIERSSAWGDAST
jgi:8-amino-7-oxononanoate synthase